MQAYGKMSVCTQQLVHQMYTAQAEEGFGLRKRGGKSIEHATEGDKGVGTKEGEKIAVCKRRDSIILLAMLLASFSDKGTVTHQVVVY